MPGFWLDLYGPGFYVTTDRAYVDDFTIYISVPDCGLYNYQVTHSSQEPITNDQFSFSGSFYASGTFHSATTASGSTGLNKYNISGCGKVSGGPWPWNATWQSSSQTTWSGRIVELETMESTTAAKSHTATLVK
jgi:hypothetical protein